MNYQTRWPIGTDGKSESESKEFVLSVDNEMSVDNVMSVDNEMWGFLLILSICLQLTVVCGCFI